MDIPISKQEHNKQRIISAALELLDEEGLNELSLRKLAAKVELKAPALYWYFKNKEALVDSMAEAILLNEFADLKPRATDEAWQEWLINTCCRLRKSMLSRRDGARIVAGAHLFPAVTLARLLEISNESLESAGVRPADADLIVGTVIHYTFGRVIEEQSSPTLEEIQAMDVAEVFPNHPRMARNIKRIKKTGSMMTFGEDSFEKSLRLIVR